VHLSRLIEDNSDSIWADTNDGVQELWRFQTSTLSRLNGGYASDYSACGQAFTSIEINPINPAEMTVAVFPAGVFYLT